MSDPDRPDPDELIPPFETDVDVQPLEERPEVISGMQNDTTVPGLAPDDTDDVR